MREIEKTVTISEQTAICIALHMIELHEAAKKERQVRFAAPCEKCPYAVSSECGFNWDNVLSPIFEATGFWPNLFIR